MLENSSVCIGLKCAWNGLSKQETKCDQSIYEEQSILLSGPYGDDVAFIKQFNDQIIIGKIIFYLNKYLFQIKKVYPMVLVEIVIMVLIHINLLIH